MRGIVVYQNSCQEISLSTQTTLQQQQKMLINFKCLQPIRHNCSRCQLPFPPPPPPTQTHIHTSQPQSYHVIKAKNVCI